MHYLLFLFIYFISSFIYGFSNPDKVSNIYVNRLSSTSENIVRITLQEMGIMGHRRIETVDISTLHMTLVRLDLFTSVLVEKLGDVIIINVLESPIIKDISFVGMLSKKKITEFLKEQKIHIGFFCNLQQVSFIKDSIEQYLFFSGYYISKVRIKYTFDLRLHTINFFINIQNNIKCKNKYIFFTGDVSFIRDEALESIKLIKRVNFFYDPMKENMLLPISSDFLDEIRYNYFNRGYVTCSLGYIKRIPIIDLININSYVEIHKGQRFRIHNILLRNSCVGNLNLLHNITLEDMFFGIYFNRKSIVALRDMFSYNLHKSGFVYNSITITNIKDFKNQCIDVYFTILCRKRHVSKNLIFLGTDLLDSQVTKRNSNVGTHYSWFSIDALEAGKDNVESVSPIGSNINLKIEKYKNDLFKWVNVIYDVNEDKKAHMEGNLSYSNIDGFIFTLGANLPDFLGSGKDIDFNIESNNIINNYIFTIYNSYFLHRGFGLGCNFNYTIQNLYYLNNCSFFKYVTDSLGLSFFFTISSFLQNKISLCFGYEWLNFKYTEQNVMWDVAKFLSYVGTSYREYYITISLNYDTLDKLVFPTDGLSQEIKLYTTLPMSDIHYCKFDYNFSFYKKIKDFVFNFILDFGYIYNYGVISTLPFSKYYFLGGVAGVSGYSDFTLGSKCAYGKNNSNLAYLGGTIYINTRFSLILPNFYLEQENAFRILSFCDLGYIQDYNVPVFKRILTYRNIFSSFGFSFIWNSPFTFPIELTLAFPILCYDDNVTQLISFTTL